MQINNFEFKKGVFILLCIFNSPYFNNNYIIIKKQIKIILIIKACIIK